MNLEYGKIESGKTEATNVRSCIFNYMSDQILIK